MQTRIVCCVKSYVISTWASWGLQDGLEKANYDLEEISADLGGLTEKLRKVLASAGADADRAALLGKKLLGMLTSLPYLLKQHNKLLVQMKDVLATQVTKPLPDMHY